ncbi:TetR/AcrR family transcriptional regulator [Naasia sp. SYSU D00057]|uniref:TetR/AcrR family transcriptional regulator n=1 Tax=Naasia sp. SYSU D00057 TaxID=2817380 RepID=UPI001B30A344|nr:TetR/AcrR family transcriptional regulator [Naasia sp. SYSU D00057]
MTLLETSTTPGARERILACAYDLVGHDGLEGVRIEDVAAAAGVTADEVRRRFPDEQALVLAAIEHASSERAARITAMVARAGDASAENRLLRLFGAFEEEFGRDDFDAVAHIRTLSQAGRRQRFGVRMLTHVERVRTMIGTLAAEAGLRDADDFALSCHVLLKGAVLAAVEGDTAALARAHRLARALIDLHRPLGSAPRDAVRLVPGADESEWLAVSDLAEQQGESALALVRRDAAGYSCYPNAVGYGRLGPYDTLDAALDAVVARMTPSR